MKNIWTKISLLVVVILLLQCASSNRLNRMDIASLYDYREDQLIKHVDVLAVHRDSIEVTLELNPGQFLYNKDVSDSLLRYFAKYKVEYDVFKDFNSEVPLDSGTVIRRMMNQKEWEEVPSYTFKFRQGLGSKLILRIRVIDLYRKYYQLKLIEVDKSTIASTVFIDWEENQNSYPNNWMDVERKFRHTLFRDTVLWLKNFSEPKSIPAPPYSFEDARRNPIRRGTIKIRIDSDGFGVIDLKGGSATLVADTLHEKGAVLIKTDQHFPEYKDARQLMQPLQYLISTEEYTALIRQPNARYAFENFWLDKTGTKSRARRAIKNFYTKVTYANQYFSDYRHGWRTDRGMVYIMLGLPDDVQRSAAGEIWVYERGGQNDAEAYTFKKERIDEFGSIYVLQRSKEFKIYWDGNKDRIFEGRF